MSQENVELLREFAEDEAVARAGGEFDPEAAIARQAEGWDPDIVLDAPEWALDLGGVYRGAGAVGQWWREWYAAWETLRFEYELIDAGDRVVMLLDMVLRGRTTGIEMPGRFAWVVTFRNGLMVHMKAYVSQSEALEAVGLLEQDAHTDS
jgi:ketosteroid isomerase-like protein